MTLQSEVSDPRFYADLHQGEQYWTFLRRLHRDLAPTNYLEIGIRKGYSLALAKSPTIGVDPVPILADGFLEKHPNVRVVSKTSDAFFADEDPRDYFGAPVDFAFLDGLHTSEALLRDFINTERVSARGSVIVLHDCIPTDVGMVRDRGKDQSPYSRNPNEWAGDVWSIIPTLRRHRPDLRMAFLDSPPTGIVLITDLDPNNTVLDDRFERLCAEMKESNLIEIGLKNYMDGLGIRRTASIKSRTSI